MSSQPYRSGFGSCYWPCRVASPVALLLVVACERPGGDVGTEVPVMTGSPVSMPAGAVSQGNPGGGSGPVGGSPTVQSGAGTAGAVTPPVGTDGKPVAGPGPVSTGGPAPVSGEKVACKADPAFKDPNVGAPFDYASIESKVTSAVGRLTSVDSKINQMGRVKLCGDMPSYWTCTREEQFSTPDDTAAGIRGFKFRDGPRGVSHWEQRKSASKKSTAFPVSIARSATFDLALEQSVGEAVCKEALAAGWYTVLGPTINLQKHPLSGRGQESYGEDPYWTGKMGTAFTLGCQRYGQACAKHFIGNEVEDGRTVVNAEIDEQTLRENYARPFEMVIRDADIACVMASYNKVGGVHMTNNQDLLKGLLRDKLGFKGYTLSDWAALDGNGSMSANALGAINAGLEVEAPMALYYGPLAKSTSVSDATYQTAMKHIVGQKFRFGWGDTANAEGAGNPGQNPNAKDAWKKTELLESAAHTDLARKVAIEGSVLLKNDEQLLPITAAKYKTVMVLAAPFPAGRPTEGGKNENGAGSSFLYDWEAKAGNWAEAARLGDKGSSEVFPSRSVSPFAGLSARAPMGITVSKSTSAADAKNAEVAIVVAALTSFDEGEEWQNAGDRANLELADGQADFIKQVIAANPKTVVVLEGGGPISHTGWGDGAKAIMMAWYPGMVGGEAIADLIYGTANFSGRLPQSWPKELLGDKDPSGSGVASFKFNYLHGYRLLDKENIAPLYPFGYGLSYTKFEYSNASVPCSSVTRDGIVNLTLQVKNVGDIAGDEVVQVYIKYPKTTAKRRPIKEFKAAKRVTVGKGETQSVTIPLQVKDWAYFDEATHNWIVEPVEHEIWVGPNSRDLTQAGTVPVAM